ncbi:transposase [Trichodesmium erythraeum]
MQYYSRHWQIERWFGCLKRESFDLESTHITEPESITKMNFYLL